MLKKTFTLLVVGLGLSACNPVQAMSGGDDCFINSDYEIQCDIGDDGSVATPTE